MEDLFLDEKQLNNDIFEKFEMMNIRHGYAIQQIISSHIDGMIWLQDKDDNFLYASKKLSSKFLMSKPEDITNHSEEYLIKKWKTKTGKKHDFEEYGKITNEIIRTTKQRGTFLYVGYIDNKKHVYIVRKNPIFKNEDPNEEVLAIVGIAFNNLPTNATINAFKSIKETGNVQEITENIYQIFDYEEDSSEEICL